MDEKEMSQQAFNEFGILDLLLSSKANNRQYACCPSDKG